jgi:hypothetical protein
MPAEKRVLRHPVDVLETALPLTESEQNEVSELSNRGFPAELAERLVRHLREKHTIPAGTIVEVFPHKPAGNGPDDPPTYLVRTADGLVGVTRLYNLANSAPVKRKATRKRERISLWNYETECQRQRSRIAAHAEAAAGSDRVRAVLARTI